MIWFVTNVNADIHVRMHIAIFKLYIYNADTGCFNVESCNLCLILFDVLSRNNSKQHTIFVLIFIYNKDKANKS